MPGPTLTPAAGGGFNTPAAANLIQAEEALAKLTTAVTAFRDKLAKGEEADASEALAATQAAAAELAEKAEGGIKAALTQVAELAAELAAVEDMPAEEMAVKIKELMTMLETAVNGGEADDPAKNAAPPPAAAPPVDPTATPAPAATDKNADGALAAALRTVSDSCVELAGRLNDQDGIAKAEVTSAKGIADQLDAMVTKMAIVKSETAPRLPDVFGTESPLHAEIAKGAIEVLRDIAGRAATVAKMVDGVDPSDASKKEIGVLAQLATALQERMPTFTAKAATTLQESISNTAMRILNLSDRVAKSTFADAVALREFANTRTLIDAVIAKQVDGGTPSMTDLGQVLQADKWLGDFERRVAAHETASAAPAPAPAAPAVPATPPATVAKSADPASDAFKTKFEALKTQMNEMQTAISKAAGITPPPAAGGGEGDKGGQSEYELFPDNFNDPAFKAEVAKREQAPNG